VVATAGLRERISNWKVPKLVSSSSHAGRLGGRQLVVRKPRRRGESPRSYSMRGGSEFDQPIARHYSFAIASARGGFSSPIRARIHCAWRPASWARGNTDQMYSTSTRTRAPRVRLRLAPTIPGIADGRALAVDAVAKQDLRIRPPAVAILRSHQHPAANPYRPGLVWSSSSPPSPARSA